MARQADAVRAALGDEFASVGVSAAICFVAADWSLFARPFELDGVQVLWPSALGKLIRAEGRLDGETIGKIERRIAVALPAA